VVKPDRMNPPENAWTAAVDPATLISTG